MGTDTEPSQRPAPPPYKLTRHAKNKQRRYRGEWEVPDALILDIITNPDHVTPTDEGRSNAWRHMRDRWLVVTFIQEQATTTIVTVTYKDRGPTPEELGQ